MDPKVAQEIWEDVPQTDFWEDVIPSAKPSAQAQPVAVPQEDLWEDLPTPTSAGPSAPAIPQAEPVTPSVVVAPPSEPVANAEEPGVWENYVEPAAEFARVAAVTAKNKVEQNAATFARDWNLISPETSAASIKQDEQDLLTNAPVPRSVVEGAKAAKALEANANWTPSDLLALTVNHPEFLAFATLESMGESVAMAPAQMAGGAVGGLGGSMAATGVTSYIQDYSSQLQQIMRDNGYDPTSAESVENAYANPEFLDKMRTQANKHAIPVAVFDALTMGISGRVGGFTSRLFSSADSILARSAAYTAKLGTEAGSGMAGELGGSLWSTGTYNPVDVYMEGFGELGAAPIDIAMNSMFGREEATTSNTPVQPGQAIPPPQPTEDLYIPTADVAAERGRSYYGFTTYDPTGFETPFVEVDSRYETTEAAMGADENRDSRMIAVEPDQVMMHPDDFVGAVANKQIDPDTDIDYNGAQDPTRAKQLVDEAVAAQSPDEARVHYLEALALGAKIFAEPGSQKGIYVGDTQSKQVLPWHADPMQGEFTVKSGNTADPAVLVENKASHLVSNIAGVNPPRYKWYDIRKIAAKLEDKWAPFTYKGSGTNITDWAKYVSGEAPTVAAFHSMLADPTVKDYDISIWVRNMVKDGKLRFKMTSRTLRPEGLRFVNTTPKEVQAVLDDAMMVGAPDPAADTSPFISSLVRSMESDSGADMFDQSGQALVEGNVQLALNGLDPNDPQSQVLMAFAKVAAKLMQKFGINKKLLIDYAWNPNVDPWAPGTDSQIGGSGRAGYINAKNGFMHALKGGDVTIVLGSGFSVNEMYRILAHEFGHAISFWKFSQASEFVRGQIFAAYRRFLAGHKNDPTFAFFAKRRAQAGIFMDPKYGARYSWGGSTEFYGLKFEEWFAEQVARWMASDRRAMGPVARFFKTVARHVTDSFKQLWARFPGASFRPEKEMEAWLGSLYEGKTDVNWAPQAQTWFDAETRVKNERWFGEGAVPMQPQSIPLRQIISAFGPTAGPIGLGPMSNGVAPTTPAQTAAQIGAFVDKFNWFQKWAWSFRNLADRYPGLKPLQAYRSLIGMMQNYANQIMGQSDARIRAWRALGSDQAGRLTAFIFDLDQMVYLSPQEKAKGVRRWPTAQEYQALVTQHGLSSEALKLYRDPTNPDAPSIWKDFDSVITRTEMLAMRAAMKIADPAQQQMAIKAAQDRSRQLRKAPYFPHTRFGTWSVTVRINGKLVHFETRETKAQQKQLLRELQQQYGAQNVTDGVIPEDVRQFMGMPPWMMEKLMDLPGLTPQQKEWMEQLQYEVAPSVSHRKHLMKRKNYEGYSRDGMRVYARYFFHHARQAARLAFQEDLNAQVQILEDAHKVPGVSATPTMRIANYLRDHLNEVMNPSKDWALVRSAAAVWHLGFMPKAALLNMMQMPAVTGPFLGAKFGDGKAMMAMMWAIKDFRAFYRQPNIHNIPEPQFRALSWGIETGVITESFAADLAAIGQGGRIRAGGKGLQESWVWFSDKAMKLFHLAEQVNRRTTFLAAWKLAMENPQSPYLQEVQRTKFLEIQHIKNSNLGGPMTHNEAVALAAAKDAVERTQYVYDQPSRARFMRGRKGALATFYSYTLNTLLLMWNNKTDVAPRMLLALMILAGPLGILPDDVEDLINFIARHSLGKDFNLEREARELVSGIVGPDWADSLLLGASRNSFGIPWLLDMAGVSWAPRFDMSRSVGLTRLLPLDITGLLEPGKDFNKKLREATEGVAGAAFGPGLAIGEAVANSDLNWYDFKRWEKAIPAAGRAIGRSFRLAYEGAERDKNYNQGLDFDINDGQHFAELVGMALGFNPTRRAQYYDRMRAQMEIDAYWQITREGLMRDAFNAKVYNMGDFKDVVEDIKQFNANVPDPKKRIGSDNLKQSLKRRMRNKLIQERGLRPDTLGDSYPEVERHGVSVAKPSSVN